MPIDLSKKNWLSNLVDEELAAFDPVAARLRLPPEVREAHPDGPSLEARARMLVVRSLRPRRVTPGPPAEEESSAFLCPIQGHIALLLDLALLLGGPFELARRRAELAGFFAAAVGEQQLAASALPRGGAVPSESTVKKAFARAGAGLRKRFYPPGDPAQGIPLYPGMLAVLRRLLGRIAIAYYRKGTLDRAALGGYLAYALHELACLAEVLIAFAAAGAPLDVQRRLVVERQVARLRLPRALARPFQGKAFPRPVGEIAKAVPARMRPFLVEQLLLASVGVSPTPGQEEVIAHFAEAAQLGPDQVAAMKVEAAAFHATHAQLFRAASLTEPDWAWSLAPEWEEMGDQMMERISAIFSDNLEAIVTELKQTGELGQLLAKATSGKTLTPDEKRKMKEQLIDLARVVPALAIFAAPGGMLLLPLLARLLPFQLLPSAFQPQARKSPAEPEPTAGPEGET